MRGGKHLPKTEILLHIRTPGSSAQVVLCASNLNVWGWGSRSFEHSLGGWVGHHLGTTARGHEGLAEKKQL